MLVCISATRESAKVALLVRWNNVVLKRNYYLVGDAANWQKLQGY